MGVGFLRNRIKSQQLFSIQSLLFRHSATTGASILRNGYRHHQTSKAHSRFPSLSKDTSSTYRNAKELDFSVPGLFTSPASGIGFVGWYLRMVKSRPILTKSVTAAFIYTAADLTSQTIAEPSSVSFDLVRTLRMAGYGLIVLGPSLHFWFNFVSKILPKCDVVATLKKIFWGQAVFGPIMTVVFFSTNAALQGESSSQIIARLKRDLFPTLLRGVMYWPICDYITFKFVPVHLQPLVSNSFSYLWTIYLTYMASLEEANAE